MAKAEEDHITSIIPEDPRRAARAYLHMCKASGKRANTLSVYERSVMRFVDYLKSCGINKMTNITADQLREFFLTLREDHSIGGIEVIYRPIHAWFVWYWDEYEIESRNPITRVKIDHQKPEPKPGVPLEDVEAMITACTGRLKLRDRAILLGLLSTCCRATEFCKLTVGDVDYVTGRTWIKAGNVKSNKGRAVRFGDRALRALRRYLKTRGELRKSEPLFVNDSGEHLDRFSLRLMIDRRADDAGVPHAGLHDFRRRGAYELWKRTRDIKAVSEYLGHSNVSVTERYICTQEDDVLGAHERAEW